MAASSANLVYMANQIAANLAAQGEQSAIAETVRHIQLYWDPRMKSAIRSADPAALSPIARAAIARLDLEGKPQ